MHKTYPFEQVVIWEGWAAVYFTLYLELVECRQDRACTSFSNRRERERERVRAVAVQSPPAVGRV